MASELPNASYFDISCYFVFVNTAAEWPCLGFRRSGRPFGLLAAAAALAMAARGRGRHGPWSFRRGGFGPFFGGPGGVPRGPRARPGGVRPAPLVVPAGGPADRVQ